MAISRLTAWIIAGNDSAYAVAYPKDGKHGFAIWVNDQTPSGSTRSRLLLTSDPTYTDAESAKAEGDRIISSLRNPVETPSREDN